MDRVQILTKIVALMITLGFIALPNLSSKWQLSDLHFYVLIGVLFAGTAVLLIKGKLSFCSSCEEPFSPEPGDGHIGYCKKCKGSRAK